MARGKNLVWTSSADVLWDGEVPTTFRGTVASIVGRDIRDDEWEKLQRIVAAYSFRLNHEHAAYSFRLNHEHQAEPLSRQQEQLKNAAKKAQSLLEALDTLNRPEMGTAVHSLVGDFWEQNTRRGAENERMEAGARSALSQTLKLNGFDDEVSDELTTAIFQDWYASGFLTRPHLTEDFLIQLRELNEALAMAARSENLSVRAGSGFDELVGRLFEWRYDCRLQLSSIKQSEFNNHGKMTYLVKAILGLVPEFLDEAGNKLPVQIREPVVADATLAGRILDARKRYEAARPRAN
ncbi:MAG: hypothetical protein ABS76_14425 [Pelagibacterium sp. SCN 64-44]|nr:MAG: hypothetical protein ABS76_14425 [Pelagibacterium sp. SCN 64-44]